jgi:hypothetical protein
LRYVATISPSESNTTLVFERFSRPSRSSTIEPPTRVIPWMRAQLDMAATDSPPSTGSALSW